MINIGTIFNCSKLSETIPIIKPSKLNVKQVKKIKISYKLDELYLCLQKNMMCPKLLNQC